MIADNFMWFPDCPVDIQGETEDRLFRGLKAFEVQSFHFSMSMGDRTAAEPTDDGQNTSKGVGGAARSTVGPTARSTAGLTARPAMQPVARTVQAPALLSEGMTVGGQVIAPVKFQTLTVTKVIDYASPMLYKALCQCGEKKKERRIRIPSAMLAMRKPGGQYLLYAQFIFRDVVVSKIEWDGGGGDKTPTEKVTFVFNAMGFQYLRQAAKGSVATRWEWHWNTAESISTLAIQGDSSSPPDYI